MDQDPHKPNKGVEMGVPVDKMPYDAPMGVPVAAPAPGYPPQQQQYGQAPPPYYAAPPPAYPPHPYAQQQPYGQPSQVDAYGRPVVNAVPMAQAPPVVIVNNANIQRDAQGNALCRKCGTPYPLPAGCTSWRCRQCHELNNASIYGDECCILM